LTRPLALLALLLLSACSPKLGEVAAPVVIEEEPVFVEPGASAGLTGPDCQPGDDDGIGGTGCKVN
jgi:hypothetical protein